jgi:hypothetical protein
VYGGLGLSPLYRDGGGLNPKAKRGRIMFLVVYLWGVSLERVMGAKTCFFVRGMQGISPTTGTLPKRKACGMFPPSLCRGIDNAYGRSNRLSGSILAPER